MLFYPVLNFNIIFLTTAWSIMLFLPFRFLITIFCVFRICCKPWTLRPISFDSSQCQKSQPIYHEVFLTLWDKCYNCFTVGGPLLCTFIFRICNAYSYTHYLCLAVDSFDSSINRYSICTPVLVSHGDEMWDKGRNQYAATLYGCMDAWMNKWIFMKHGCCPIIRCPGSAVFLYFLQCLSRCSKSFQSGFSFYQASFKEH
jgi:hypothetical protein